MTAKPTILESDTPGKSAHTVRSVAGRYRTNTIFRGIALIGTVMAIMILLVLLLSILLKGITRFNGSFITSMASYQADEAGIYASLIGTVVICAICALSALPLGVGTAVLIEEFQPKNRILRRIHDIVETNIRNLAGVPSIVYGILGVTAFAAMFGIFGIAGQSNIAIGQKWYDQYSDAQGNLLFIPVESYTAPSTPLYTSDVTKPQRFEVWRGSDPILVGSQTDVEAAAAEEAASAPTDATPEATAKAPADASTDPSEAPSAEELVEQRLDAMATLDITDNNWVITPDAATAESIDFQKLGVQPGDILRFGFLFDEFSQREVYSRFEITQVQPDSLSVYGTKIDSFLDAAQPDAKRVERQVMDRESFAPMMSQINKDIQAFEDTMQDGINASRDGDRNTGPARIDEATAKKIADKAIASGPFTGDTTKLRDSLIKKLVALDGMDSRDLRASRRELVNDAVDAEKQARLSGKIMTGQNPNRVDYKSWYYISLPFGRGVLAGGLTLMLVVLPIVIVASQEALRGVPSSYRQGALALGATKWQSVSKTALPAAIPGICTGTILAVSRAIGEAAPILILGGVVFINFTPGNLMDKFTVLPLQIYNWSSQPSDDFREIAAAGIIVLLIVLLSFNALAIYIRHRASKHQ